jgi:uncharacterized membrane protein YuzA (DUF378 family)
MVLVALVLIGGVNWGLHAFGYNVVEFIGKSLKLKYLEKVVYVLVALSAIWLAFDRTSWLPFLGDSVLPAPLVSLKSHEGDTSVVVKVSPNVKVAYWAANPGKNPEVDVYHAYGNFENSGVVQADAHGNAVLKFDKGTAYVVPSGKHLGSHVHYREVSGIMMGPVQSVFV